MVAVMVAVAMVAVDMVAVDMIAVDMIAVAVVGVVIIGAAIAIDRISLTVTDFFHFYDNNIIISFFIDDQYSEKNDL